MHAYSNSRFTKSFVGKYFVVRYSTTKVLPLPPPRKIPAIRYIEIANDYLNSITKLLSFFHMYVVTLRQWCSSLPVIIDCTPTGVPTPIDHLKIFIRYEVECVHSEHTGHCERTVACNAKTRNEKKELPTSAI